MVLVGDGGSKNVCDKDGIRIKTFINDLFRLFDSNFFGVILKRSSGYGLSGHVNIMPDTSAHLHICAVRIRSDCPCCFVSQLKPIYTNVLNISIHAMQYVYPLDLTEVEEELKCITEKLRVSRDEAVREAIRFFATELKVVEIVELRDIPKEQARKEIINFLTGKDRVWADEIADALRLDLAFVNDMLKELWEEGYVEPD